MTRPTVICFFGYALASAIIIQTMQAGPVEILFSYLGAIPIGCYCAICDRKETKA